MMNDDRSPQLSQGIETRTLCEPMLSRHNVTRLGSRQSKFMDWLNAQHRETGGDVSLLDCWRWMHTETGNRDRLDCMSEKKRERNWQQYGIWTSASLGSLLRSLHGRGLLVVVPSPDNPDHSFVRSRMKDHDFGSSNQ